jgi:hypothetical protein
MTRNLAVMSIPRIFNSDHYNPGSIERYAGGNTGNFVFTEAIYRLLDNDPKGIDYIGWDADYVNSEFKHVVLAAANFLNENSDWSNVIQCIEKLKIPVTTIGIGVQASIKQESSPKIHPTAVELIHLLSTKSTSIGVRGHYSDKIIKGLGIYNTRVIGCPSLYANIYNDGLKEIRNRVVIQGTRFLTDTKFWEKDTVNTSLFRVAYKLGAEYIFQSERAEIELLLSNFDLSQITATQISDLLGLYDASDIDSLVGWLSNHGHVFTSVYDWSEFLSSSVGSITSRIHGSILTLNNGRPTILLPHDSRTLELGEIANIPMDRVSSLEVGSHEDLVQKLNSVNLNKYQDTRSQNQKTFKAFISENGLSLNSRLLF